MKSKWGYSFIYGILLLLLVSCMPLNDVIDNIHRINSSLAFPPTYTFLPTYTNPPIITKEVTRLIYITETNTPSSIYSPTFTYAKTPPIMIVRGTGTLKAIPNHDSIKMSYFDLDTGKNEDNETSDIEYYVGCGSGCFPGINLHNGAIGFIFGRKEPTYEDCAANMYPESEIFTLEYICIKTSQNNISVLKILLDCSVDSDGAEIIIFSYNTWKSY